MYLAGSMDLRALNCFEKSDGESTGFQ